MTRETALVLILLALVGAALAAILVGAAAVALVGPWRRSLIPFPALAAFAAAIWTVFGGSRFDDFWWLLAAVAAALVVAFVQARPLRRVDRTAGHADATRARNPVIGALLGAMIGGVLGVVGGSLITAAMLAALGAVCGATILVARTLGCGSDVTPKSPAILDHVSELDRAALIVALDGPASSGKSSVGAAAALALGYRFCDTGLLYRAATWLALRQGVAADGDPAALVALVPEIELVPDDRGRLAHVTVDGVDVTADVHTPVVDEAVSAISRVPELRTALLARQRDLAAEPGGIVMAGRDIGTVVLPDADLKIFLDASVEERARRRTLERGIDPSGAEGRAIFEQLRRRDDLDRNRPVAPLRPAADAIHIVTDGNAFEETVAAVVAEIRAAERRRAASTAAT